MIRILSLAWALALAPCSVALAAVDGQPALDARSDTGFYVWRAWNGDWHARLVAAAGWQRFAATFTSADLVSALRPVALEANDVLATRDQRTVAVDFKAARHTMDGLRLSAGRGGVCLESTSPVPIYLGSQKTPATAPVDLTGTNACATGTLTFPRTPGFTVYRATRLDWQARLASASGTSSFTGMFELSAPPDSLEPVSVESGDRVDLPWPRRLAVQLNVWPANDDGLKFTTPEFTDICLRSTTGQQQDVGLLSPGQKTPLRVRTPVDLTNTGACGVPQNPLPPPTRGRKFNAGHYVVLTAQDDETSLAESLVPGVEGFVKRYDWRGLEPVRGTYDLSPIAADLAVAAQYGVQLVAQIDDKSFNKRMPMPAYLADRTRPNVSGGYTVVRWDPYVIARYKALVAAIGARFDGHARFEGIATTESAHGLDQAAMTATGYTPEKYRDALLEMLTAASGSLPTSRVFWFMNFLWGGNHYLGDIARRVTPLGVVMGGPDIMPDNAALQRQTYPFYRGAAGRMPLFGQVEPSCYQHPHADPSSPTRYWTPQELFEFARDELHVSYLFWVRWRYKPDPEAYNWWDAMPVIEGNTRFNR